MFAEHTELRQITIQGTTLTLELNEQVFAPSKNGSFYANTLQIHPGDRVIDIGTGSGVLAIYAALQGGQVCATDIEAEAVELATKNCALNKVQADIRQGSLFSDFSGTFDVIAANLPNEIVPPVYADKLGKHAAETFDGGEKGNKFILELLEISKKYMHANSRLYLPVHSLTDYHEVLQAALSQYQVRLLALANLPAKEFVQQHLDYYLAMNEQGIIKIFKKGDQWHTHGYVYEVMLAS
ncbi:methyltransferase [Rhodocytophaga rosea]|uniref:Methyltransferase n=1 Tax=Rhodocytophaga rosea TaxID=2704465 RepID=A0A6C0GEP5_9BACT|nr:50S ribosomal protein L11 methyltransferase [Rhodocytophaga rosea]QHT66294.1 methyltransferase [Rhodocytophaga rosea]